MAKKNNQKNKQVIPVGQDKSGNNSHKEKGGSITVIDLISLVISVIAVVVSCFTLHYSNQYSKLEYEYKVDPQIEITGRPEMRVNPSGGAPLTTMGEIQVSIVEKNNLDRAFVIYGDNHVERMDLDDMEGTLEGKIKSGLDTKADIVSGVWEYRFFFLYLEGLNGENNLYLIYTKSLPGAFAFNAASGIEVYGMEKAEYKNDSDYVGEKLMAQKYVQLLKDLPDYLCQ